MRNLSELPELVRDSRLEVHFQPNATQPMLTIQLKVHGRRSVSGQEVWVREKMLGHGGYGMVWLERNAKSNQTTPQLRAVKQIRVHKWISSGEKYIRELEALAKFSQDKFRDSFVRSYGWYESPQPEWLFIAMEYCEHGDLKNYLSKHGSLSEHQVQDITMQLVHGLSTMHENGFAHRDLKPANILIRSQPPDEWWIKICDLGLSKRIDGEMASTTVRGTPGCMPPELMGFDEDPRNVDAFAADMWCCGETVCQMLISKSPFDNLGTLIQYKRGLLSFPAAILMDKGVSPAAIDMVRSIMAADPAKRMTAINARKHAWLQSSPMSDIDIDLSSLNVGRSYGALDFSSMADLGRPSGAWTQPSGAWTRPMNDAHWRPGQPDTVSELTIPSRPLGRPSITFGSINLPETVENLQPSPGHFQRQAPYVPKLPKFYHPPPQATRRHRLPTAAEHGTFEGNSPASDRSSGSLTVEGSEDVLKPRSSVEPETVSPATPTSGNRYKIQRLPTETVEQDVVKAFKEFVRTEKAVREQKDKKMQRDKEQRDKALRLLDLKNFAQTFKLHTEIPPDLVPILSQDEDKQKEIKAKAIQNAAEERKRLQEKEQSEGTASAKPDVPRSWADLVRGADDPNGQPRSPLLEPQSSMFPPEPPLVRLPPKESRSQFYMVTAPSKEKKKRRPAKKTTGRQPEVIDSVDMSIYLTNFPK